MISSQFIAYKREIKLDANTFKFTSCFFFLAEKGHLMQKNMWLSNQEKSARILLIIMLAILDQMRTSFLALMPCNRIPTCVIFRVLFVTLYSELRL